MARFLPAIAAFAGVSLTGLALYPVLARDIDGFDIIDPMDLVIPSEPVSIVETVDPALDSLGDPATAIAEPDAPVLLAPPAPAKPVGPVVISTHSGEASWYGPGFYGNRTANGEVFRPGTMTAAHRTLPFGTRVRVTNLWNGRKAVVRINDRGPFAGDRVIDLAHGAARELGLMSSGIAQVRLEVLRLEDGRRRALAELLAKLVALVDERLGDLLVQADVAVVELREKLLRGTHGVRVCEYTFEGL